MATYKRAVGLFYSRDEAEAALRALKNDGFDMKRVNLIARDAELAVNNESNHTFENLGDLNSLVSLGIPEAQAQIYSDRVAGGSYLLMINGSESEIDRAESILRSSGIEELGIYDAPDLTNINRTATVDSQRPIATEPIMTEPSREMSVPDQDPNVAIIRDLENLP